MCVAERHPNKLLQTYILFNTAMYNDRDSPDSKPSISPQEISVILETQIGPSVTAPLLNTFLVGPMLFKRSEALAALDTY